MAHPVGIDDLNIYASTLSVEFADLVAAHGISERDFHNVRFVRRSLVPSYEDPVTLAVNAAKPIVEEAGPDAFDLLIIATETGIDYAKPLSSYVHRYLHLAPSCRNFEIKHACYAGTAAIQMAASWVRSEVVPGKRALVIMTDIGRRHFGESAELSVGAGAVALSITAHPRVFELEAGRGYVSQEVYDTARPTIDSEWIDPPLSLASYLDLLEMAWDAYRSAFQADQGSMGNGHAEISFARHFSYVIFHTPLMSIIERAHRLLLEGENGGLTPDEATASFEQRVAPSLRYNREIGNIYSGTLYVALAGLLDTLPGLNGDTRIGCFSYGSGSCAELFSGFAGKEAHATIAARRIGENLAARRKLTIAEYESVVLAGERSLSVREFEPDWDVPSGHYEQTYQGQNRLVLARTRNHHRTYRWS